MDLALLAEVAPELARYFMEHKIEKTEDQMLILLALQFSEYRKVNSKLDGVAEALGDLKADYRRLLERLSVMDKKLDVLVERNSH